MTFDQSDQETCPAQNRHWQWQWHSENTLKEESRRFVAFETLITFLTIKNNNLIIHRYPCIKSDGDSVCNSCDVYYLKWCEAMLRSLQREGGANNAGFTGHPERTGPLHQPTPLYCEEDHIEASGKSQYTALHSSTAMTEQFRLVAVYLVLST